MMQRHEMKTRQQLVNLITAHTQTADCEMCGKFLGKIVLIPVDCNDDFNTVILCNDCRVEYILLQKQSLLARITRWIRTLQKKSNA
jgi:hypothetical protein